MANNLTSNLTKSNIIINPKNSPIGTKPITVSIHQHFLPSLSTVTAAKYLDVVLDDSLSFKTHINMWTKKLSRAVGALSKVKLILNKFSLLSLYSVMIFIWSERSGRSRPPLQKCRKAAPPKKNAAKYPPPKNATKQLPLKNAAKKAASKYAVNAALFKNAVKQLSRRCHVMSK